MKPFTIKLVLIMYFFASSGFLFAQDDEVNDFRIEFGKGDSAQILMIHNLTGQWRCNDGGTYYIRQVDLEIWWYGRSANGGQGFSNVFHGFIQKSGRIEGRWADVPMGRMQNSGKLVLQIGGSRILNAVSNTGGFGGGEWTR
ncbi:hypothetical protein QU481_09210 [Crenobacter sp. SG2303]|uniref:Uncharacterized protein n=1 Tax=Crenobacter oryzisoli TaxID=3056844 RepID=A0ABT7XMS3_9NEIS|nr:hypothetical protein [Crenobacter sp. SG2303]MDN0075071.1 hypothetical protein [Crenobacter sp. SG2303]